MNLSNKYRLLVLESLKVLSLDLLQNCYSPERTDRVIVRVKEFMDNIFPIIENKSMSNMNFLESSSEFVFILLEKAPNLLIQDFKKNILSIFNKAFCEFWIVLNIMFNLSYEETNFKCWPAMTILHFYTFYAHSKKNFQKILDCAQNNFQFLL